MGLAFLPVALLIAAMPLLVTNRVMLRLGPRRTLIAGVILAGPIFRQRAARCG